MGKTKDKAIKNGVDFILNYLGYAIGGPILASIFLTRLDKKHEDEVDWRISPAYYGLPSNYIQQQRNKHKGGGKKRQRGGDGGQSSTNSIPLPFSLDNKQNNNIMQYVGGFFKEDWFNFRNIMKTWIMSENLNYLKIEPSPNMWIPWKSVTYKNILKMTGVVSYFSILLPIIASIVAIFTTLWAIFTNPYLEKYKEAKERDDAVYMYWLLMFFGIFWCMFFGGFGLWASSIGMQVILFLVYIVLSPLQYYTNVWNHVRNLLNLRKSLDGESKSHGILKWLMFTVLCLLIGLGNNNWLTYNPMVMGVLFVVEIFILILYYKYH